MKISKVAKRLNRKQKVKKEIDNKVIKNHNGIFMYVKPKRQTDRHKNYRCS